MEIEREAETMEERLCYAAMKGDLPSLREIIARDDSFLDRVLAGIFKGKNPLHVAISTGQTEIVSELLQNKPGLAEVLDPKLGAPLHIASAKGHLEIVGVLTNICPKMCLACDGDGNSPLHIAAMNGHDDVLAVLLVSTNSFVAQAKVDRGDTILHLCVKYDQFKCLQLLLENISDPYFVNDVDANGNTILHLAVFEKRLETIRHVLSNKKIVVNATNNSGRSALDILLQFPEGNQSDPEIKKILLDAGAKRFKRGKYVVVDHLELSWMGHRRNTFMIVFSLIATMAYQVGVNPPGGVWQDNAADHKAGKAILAYNYPDLYPIFMCLNTGGFLLSLTTILVLIISLPVRGRPGLSWAQSCISWIMFLTTAFSYTFGVIAISPNGEKYMYDSDAGVAVKYIAFVWGGLVSLILVYNFLHLIRELRRSAENCMNMLFEFIRCRRQPPTPNLVIVP